MEESDGRAKGIRDAATDVICLNVLRRKSDIASPPLFLRKQHPLPLRDSSGFIDRIDLE